MDLYSTYAQEFSASRQSPWDGWKPIVKYFNLNSSILDLGCGNGRFLKFLKSKDINFKSYIGVDNSKDLLSISQDYIEEFNLNNTSLKYVDLNLLSWGNNFNTKFNIIVAFGITHHLNSPSVRKKFFETVSYLLEKDGIFIVTFWEFLKMERYLKKIQPLNSSNDFEMSFGKNGAKRFCHFYSNLEIIELTHNKQFKLIEEYYSDGIEKNQNKYFIFKKE